MSEVRAGAESTAVVRLHAAFDRLAQARSFAKRNHQGRFLDAAQRLLLEPEGLLPLYALADRFDEAGVFEGTDWNEPARLQPSLVPGTLAHGNLRTVTLECLSQLRILALAEGRTRRFGFSAERADVFLRDVLALNLDFVFDRTTEARRARGNAVRAATATMQFVAEHVGHGALLEQVVAEIWRLLRQRPLVVEPVRKMIGQLAACCYAEGADAVPAPAGAERLISALWAPSPASRGDPGLGPYDERLARMDVALLQEEAGACARAMLDTGLVSPYHASLLRHLLAREPGLLPQALGLSSTGVDGYLTYRDLVHALVDAAVHPETCQCIYGLTALLERAVLHQPGVAPSLWRQLRLVLGPAARARIAAAFGETLPAETHLLAGTIAIVGQPLGVGQGDNPTCQAARALSIWAYSDVVYLLQLLAWAARDDDVLMTFNGEELSSAALPLGAAGLVGLDVDAVSCVLVPHLDRLYAEMARRAPVRSGDPHEFVNPEYHGWQVGRGFALAVDVATGALHDHETFLRRFWATYHPQWNGGHPVIHPQPVGVAVTDAAGRFVGWHAITLLRVTLDPQGEPRVYFFNPNNDGGQDWGQGVVVSTEGHGETHGESSLPFADFASRLYLYHYDRREVADPAAVPADEIARVRAAARGSWARDRTGAEAP